jgi:anti-sigma factor RsiW
MLKYLRYRYATAKMAAYVNGELPLKTRRFISRFLDEDPRVYEEYIRQRQTKLELERQLPVFGRPQQKQLDSIWTAIQAEMNAPDKSDITPTATRPRYSLGYGLAVVLCALALLVPLAFDTSRANASAVPEKPLPETVEFTTPSHDTPSAQPTSIAVAARTETRATDDVADLQNTPAPHTPG